MTSFEEEGFFHALQQDPDDDTLRLVYADFVEERGDSASAARAEFIRVQVELASLNPRGLRNADRVEELTRRENELLEAWERIWLGGWDRTLTRWKFRRGLLEVIETDASEFIEFGQEWLSEWPTLSAAKLTRANGHLEELGRCPALAHLQGLDLSDNQIAANELVYLTCSRFICLLRGLDLSRNPLGSRGATLLATATWADELSELHLAGCCLGGAGLNELLTERFRQWKRLDLSDNGIVRRDLARLVDSPVMLNVVSLDLARNPLGDHGVAPIADSPQSANLTDLGLSLTGVGDQELASLASSTNLRSLRSLDLRSHQCWPKWDRDGVDRSGIGDLSRSPLLGQLRRLLLGPAGPSNGWVSDVLRDLRRPREEVLFEDFWAIRTLRDSRYLMPSQLIECDLEELWWLGNTKCRQRLPSWWKDE